jgi:hypothetical protein
MLRKTAHIFFAILILVSTTGIGVKKHFCGKKHVFTTLAFLDKACCDTDLPMPPGCCREEVEYYQLDTDIQAPAIILAPDFLPDLSFAPVASILPPAASFQFVAPDFYNYIPPLLPVDIPVLFERFLI